MNRPTKDSIMCAKKKGRDFACVPPLLVALIMT